MIAQLKEVVSKGPELPGGTLPDSKSHGKRRPEVPGGVWLASKREV